MVDLPDGSPITAEDFRSSVRGTIGFLHLPDQGPSCLVTQFGRQPTLGIGLMVPNRESLQRVPSWKHNLSEGFVD